MAGRTLAPGISDDGVHRRVDDVLPADRAVERMVVEIELDGAHRARMVAKKGLRFSFALTRIEPYASRENRPAEGPRIPE
jgi:hypothetical protein